MGLKDGHGSSTGALQNFVFMLYLSRASGMGGFSTWGFDGKMCSCRSARVVLQ